MSGLVGNSRRHILSCRGSIIFSGTYFEDYLIVKENFPQDQHWPTIHQASKATYNKNTENAISYTFRSLLFCELFYRPPKSPRLRCKLNILLDLKVYVYFAMQPEFINMRLGPKT